MERDLAVVLLDLDTPASRNMSRWQRVGAISSTHYRPGREPCTASLISSRVSTSTGVLAATADAEHAQSARVIMPGPDDSSAPDPADGVKTLDDGIVVRCALIVSEPPQPDTSATSHGWAIGSLEHGELRVEQLMLILNMHGPPRLMLPRPPHS